MIAGSGKMNKRVANLARTSSLRPTPPSPRPRCRLQSHHEMAAWLGAGEERSHELEREAFHRLRTIAAAPATAAV